jgi:preprotein translocase subunit SecY
VLYLPVLLAAALPWDGFRRWINDNLAQPDNVFYFGITGVLVVGFAYFYTAITFDPVKQADTIRKQGGFVPGIRPGYQTERYLARILSRITLPGALFLACVALIPSIMINVFLDTSSGVGGSAGAGAAGFGFVGISILIAAGVSLETMKQVDSQLTMRNYEGFLK